MMLRFGAVCCILLALAHSALGLGSCDCGVRYHGPVLLADTTTTYVANTAYPVAYVQDTNQANYMCWKAVDTCDAFRLIKYTDDTVGTVFGLIMYQATTLDDSTASSGSITATSFDVSDLAIIVINRVVGNQHRGSNLAITNAIDAVELDPVWYYFESNYRSLIETTHCPYFEENANLCCWRNITTVVSFVAGTQTRIERFVCEEPLTWQLRNLTGTELWELAAVQHFEDVGIFLRLSVSPHWHLGPPSYTPESNCFEEEPGCLGECSKHGYCESNPHPTSSHPLRSKCACDLNPTEFDGWVGNACQHPKKDYCWREDAEDDDMCVNSNEACISIVDPETASGEFPDFIAKCDCAGLEGEGQYCTISKCTHTAGGCATLDEEAECVQTNATTDSWECQCSQSETALYFGPECRNSTCLCKDGCTTGDESAYEDTNVCGTAGSCMLPSPRHTTANTDAFEPWCKCDEGMYGEFCTQTACNASIAIPAQSICEDSYLEFTRCQDPFFSPTGAIVKCRSNACSLSGGTTLGDPYGYDLNPACSCPLGKTLVPKANNLAPSYCLADCPKDAHNVTCGLVGVVCDDEFTGTVGHDVYYTSAKKVCHCPADTHVNVFGTNSICVPIGTNTAIYLSSTFPSSSSSSSTGAAASASSSSTASATGLGEEDGTGASSTGAVLESSSSSNSTTEEVAATPLSTGAIAGIAVAASVFVVGGGYFAAVALGLIGGKVGGGTVGAGLAGGTAASAGLRDHGSSGHAHTASNAFAAIRAPPRKYVYRALPTSDR